MKKIYFLFFIFFTSPIVSVFAQAPFGINYQAVARDASGNPIANQTLPVIFNIHQSAPNGPISCSETQSIGTNSFGLFSWVIGSSNHTNFDSIPWGKHKYFLEVIVNSNSMGTTQFFSVPYAFHAHTADSVKNMSSLTPWTRSGGNISPAVSTDNVGIGTNSPGAKLEVVGQIKITDGNQGANKILTSDANGVASWQNLPSPPNLGFSNMVVFTSTITNTWAVPAGVNKIMIEVWGGGGGGAGATVTGAGGGGGGGYGKGTYTVTPGSTLTVTIGNGGNGGPSGTAGVAGQPSSVNGTLISANGGAGGLTTGVGGAGGNSSAPFNITGGFGFYGGTNYLSYGGAGANGGTGGLGGANSAGGAGIAPGGGGGGSYAGITAAGGNGAVGRVVIWW